MRREEHPGGAAQVEVLGPLRLIVDGQPVEVPGPRRRAVLALLARAEGRLVAVTDLLTAVWPADPADRARASLHSHISRLRRHLGPAADRLQTAPDGYRLQLDAGALDAARARSLLDQAGALAARQPAAAYRLAREARELWRGAVLADLAEVAALAAWAASLDELRRAVDECYLHCAVAAGQPEEAVGPAREAVAAQPLRETPVRLLMQALAATGRGAEALREGYAYRRRLTDQTGLDPTPALAAREREIAGSVPSPVRPAAGRTRLIGRESELAALHRLLGTERLVTVIGPGGVGKTSLALELTRQVPDLCALHLAPVTDPAAVLYALAAALDLRAVRGDLLAACLALLNAGSRVLVVDNCEHLLPAARELIGELVDRCTQLTVLATSREPLGLPAERQFRLAPLPLPAVGAPVAGSGNVPAVAVFLHRARRIRPQLGSEPDELRLVGDIVRRLDGMPLAIELAAGRVSSLSLGDLHARLDRALDLLAGSADRGSGPASNGDIRHRTLRSTIEWSYQLLTGYEQRLFRHLAVFPDGFDLPTVEEVAAGLRQPEDPATALARLVDTSMVDARFDGRPRYRMLETLRAYGLDRLAAAGETPTAQGQLVRWALTLAGWIYRTEPTEQEPEADAALRRELANLRTGWALARRLGRLDDAITLVAGLLTATLSRDLSEVWAWARELAADPAVADHPRQAEVLGMASHAAWQRGELADAEDLARRGILLAGGDEGRRWCLSSLANIDLSRGAYSAAVERSLAAAELAPRPTEHYGVAALAAAYAGDLPRARELAQRLATVAVHPTLQALHAYVAGEIDNAAGEYDAAETHYTRAIALARTASATFVDGIAAVGLVTVRTAAGRIDEALRGYQELLDYWERTGGWLQQWTTLRNLARLLHTLGDHEPARFLEVAAERAPDAPWAPPATAPLPPEAEARIRAEAASASPARVLTVAREAVLRHRSGGGPGSRRTATS